MARAAPAAQRVGQFVHAPRHKFSANSAGRAKAAALVRKEMRKIAGHFEHVARAVKDHERARRWNVFKSNSATEFKCRQACPRWPTHLYGLRVHRATVLQDVFDSGAKWVLIQARSSTVAGHAVNFGSRGLGSADGGPPLPAMHGNLRGSAERFNVVDNGWLPQIAAFHRKG